MKTTERKAEMHKTFYLQPTNGRGSFGNKCHVNEYVNNEGDHYSDLVSYGTRVASYNHSTNEMSVYGWYSATTATHINAFLDFYGFEQCTKGELMKNYNLTK
jgi:hypothetical protein